jgi:ABC-type sugar transport system substrate-binding protein
MKQTSFTLAGLLAAVFAMPASAGPDWTEIHEGESHNASQQAESWVPPLDHGPRALSTPWLNKVRKSEILAQAASRKNTVLASHAAHAVPTHS